MDRAQSRYIGLFAVRLNARFGFVNSKNSFELSPIYTAPKFTGKPLNMKDRLRPKAYDANAKGVG